MCVCVGGGCVAAMCWAWGDCRRGKEMAGVRAVDGGHASLAGAQKDRKKVKPQGSLGCIWK